jgi:hypothetical protein
MAGGVGGDVSSLIAVCLCLQATCPKQELGFELDALDGYPDVRVGKSILEYQYYRVQHTVAKLEAFAAIVTQSESTQHCFVYVPRTE